MDLRAASDLAIPIAMGVLGGLLRLLMVGSGKSAVQVIRGFIISVIVGIITGVMLSDLVIAESVKLGLVAISTALSGDIAEGLFKLSKEWSVNPKSIIRLFRKDK